MKAVITGESKRIGVKVQDNNGIDHGFEMGETGEIKYREAEEYPNSPDDRTDLENELGNQARRFAQFYVYRERGYDTVEPTRNPDYIATAAMAIANLSDEQFESYFGEFYQQMRSESGDAEPVVDVPEVPLSARVRVEQDIYLGLDGADRAEIAETLTDANVFEHLATAANADGGGLLDSVTSVFDDNDADLSEEAAQVGTSVIDAVGPITVRWFESGTEQEATGSTNASVPERAPEVRLQLLGQSYEFDDIEDFRQTLVHHLLCQIRDCYIAMGIAPPEDARIQGPGFYDNIGWYSNHDIYPDYHDPSADISDWQEEHTPDNIRI